MSKHCGVDVLLVRIKEHTHTRTCGNSSRVGLPGTIVTMATKIEPASNPTKQAARRSGRAEDKCGEVWARRRPRREGDTRAQAPTGGGKTK